MEKLKFIEISVKLGKKQEQQKTCKDCGDKVGAPSYPCPPGHKKDDDLDQFKDSEGEGSCRIPKIYDSRKYGHNLPCDSVSPEFETLPYIPTGVFRCTLRECLGQGAHKYCAYKNPEYFSFHHMTFYDMQYYLRPWRQPCAKTGRKK